MANDENNQIQSEKESETKSREDSFLGAIVALSVRTLFYILLIATVSLAAISRVFPFAAMNFYSDYNNYGMAVKYARDYAERGGKHYVQVLFEGVEMSEKLLYSAENNFEAVTAAEYLVYFSEKLAGLQDFGDRCTALDDYYRENAATTVAKVGLYSFKDYIFCKNTAANSVLKKADKLMYDGDYKPFEQGAYRPLAEKGYINQDELNKLFRDLFNGDINPDLSELAVIFNQISENIAWGEGNLVFDRESNCTTPVYDLIEHNMKDGVYAYIDKVLALSASVEKLYYLRAAAVLGENVKHLFKSFTDWPDMDSRVLWAEEVFSIEREGNRILLYDFYREELIK